MCVSNTCDKLSFTNTKSKKDILYNTRMSSHNHYFTVSSIAHAPQCSGVQGAGVCVSECKQNSKAVRKPLYSKAVDTISLLTEKRNTRAWIQRRKPGCRRSSPAQSMSSVHPSLCATPQRRRATAAVPPPRARTGRRAFAMRPSGPCARRGCSVCAVPSTSVCPVRGRPG